MGQYARDHSDPSEAAIMIGRIMEGEEVGEDEMFDVLSRQESLIVGDQDQIRAGFKFYEDIGIDRLMTLHQVGALSHEKIMKSIRLVGEVIPSSTAPERLIAPRRQPAARRVDRAECAWVYSRHTLRAQGLPDTQGRDGHRYAARP